VSTYNRVVAADENASLAPTARARLATEMADPTSEVGASLSDTFVTRTQLSEFPVNQYVSVQAAIDAAYAAGGGVVRLPSGPTSVSATLTLKTGVVLSGPDQGVTVWGYSSDPRPYYAAWLEADGAVGEVINVPTTTVNAAIANLLIYASGREAIHVDDSVTRGGLRLENVHAHEGGIYLGQKEVHGSWVMVTSVTGDGLTVYGHDSDLSHVLVGFCTGDGVVLTATSGPLRLHSLDSFNNRNGLVIAGGGHRLGDIQTNNNNQSGVIFSDANNVVINGIVAANNSRESATTTVHHADVSLVGTSNPGCVLVGGRISNDGEGLYAVDSTASVVTFPGLVGIQFAGTYQNGDDPHAIIRAFSTFNIRGCSGVPDVVMPQRGVGPMFRPNGSADMIRAIDGTGGVNWGITATGVVYDKTLDMVYTIDPRGINSTSPLGAANRCIFSRVITGGIEISKIGLEIGVSAGNISVAVYANTGVGRAAKPITRVATSGAVAAPATGYAEVILDAPVTVYPGDWLALSFDDATLSVNKVSNATGSALNSGFTYRQDSAHPAPATVGTTAATSSVPILIGVP